MGTQPDKHARDQVTGRDQHRCTICERYVRAGQWPGLSIHHRLMRSQGSGSTELHEPSNLLLLCGTGTTGCHGWIHAHPLEAQTYGWLIGVKDTRPPHLVPVYNHRHGWQLLTPDGQAVPCQPPEGQPRRPDLSKIIERTNQ